ncbi:hypothetical protein DPEC_G00236090 [Dallia pectoralis]|uniref:Uncharacterized protein n=1 Tax=Dallia pectoralis TaxID=75939 RepID=A0ACC2FYB0_DALPE|nr:hypothetical protein DPEC_G00236090 [Dallia pectoralis]
MASKKTVLRVTNLSGTSSMGSNGARERPSSTMARSQDGTLMPAAGLSLRAPRRKPDTSGCLPRETPFRGTWHADKAATYTFSVDGDRPVEKRCYRNSNTANTGQLTGSTCCSLHHEVNSFHLAAYAFLVAGALE